MARLGVAKARHRRTSHVILSGTRSQPHASYLKKPSAAPDEERVSTKECGRLPGNGGADEVLHMAAGVAWSIQHPDAQVTCGGTKHGNLLPTQTMGCVFREYLGFPAGDDYARKYCA